MKTIDHVNTTYAHEEEQIDFYATINADGTPHITMLTSLHIYDEDTFLWGEYSAGQSKRNQQVRTKVGFLSLIDRHTGAFGQADWTAAEKSGEKLDALNQIPEYRYNNVNGYMPAHILKKKCFEQQELNLDALQHAKAETAAALSQVEPGNVPQAISILTRQYFAADQGFKTLAYVGSDGYPVVLPVPQAQLTSANRVVFSMDQDSDLLKIPEGQPVAIYAIEFPSMCSVLVNGVLKVTQVNGKPVGMVDVERVYNPMLPVAGQIYPPVPYEAVTKFEDTVYEYNV